MQDEQFESFVYKVKFVNGKKGGGAQYGPSYAPNNQQNHSHPYNNKNGWQNKRGHFKNRNKNGGAPNVSVPSGNGNNGPLAQNGNNQDGFEFKDVVNVNYDANNPNMQGKPWMKWWKRNKHDENKEWLVKICKKFDGENLPACIFPQGRCYYAHMCRFCLKIGSHPGYKCRDKPAE